MAAQHRICTSRVHLKDSIEKNDAARRPAQHQLFYAPPLSRRLYAHLQPTKDKLSLGKKQSSVWLLLAARSSDHAHHLHPPPIKVTSNLFALQTRELPVFQRDLIKHTLGLSGEKREREFLEALSWYSIQMRLDLAPENVAVCEINYFEGE